tara:strand:+ start:1488 stop:1787 length:300 start_codon:yes stop_codon:yes gene_type:complete
MGKKEQMVWKYLLKNKLATPTEVAKATGVSYVYVTKLMKTIGTPREVFEKEVVHLPTFDEAIQRAPIRNTVNVWTDRLWQITVIIATAVVVGTWLYVGL